LVENKKAGIAIAYGGDYWFHPLEEKSTYNWDAGFVRLLKADKQKKALLYCGHTIIEPYSSTIGLVYKDARLTETVDAIMQQLTAQKARNLANTTELVGTTHFTKLAYELVDSRLKIKRRYLEYYTTQGKDIARFVFWTTDANPRWLESEARSIVETFKVL